MCRINSEAFLESLDLYNVAIVNGKMDVGQVRRKYDMQASSPLRSREHPATQKYLQNVFISNLHHKEGLPSQHRGGAGQIFERTRPRRCETLKSGHAVL